MNWVDSESFYLVADHMEVHLLSNENHLASKFQICNFSLNLFY